MKSNEYYSIEQLAANLWAIKDIKSSEKAIMYLLCGEKKALLFDTGLGLSPLMPVIKSITNLPIVACLSHWHFDHVGSAHEFEEVIAWDSKAMQKASYQGIEEFVIKKQMDDTFFDSIGDIKLKVDKFKADLITEIQIIDLGSLKISLIHTPGHTFDSISLYESKNKWLFTGDTVYPGPIFLFNDDSDPKAFRATILQLLSLPVNRIFPGHNQAQVSAEILNEVKNCLENAKYKSQKFPSLSVRYKLSELS